MALNKLQDIGMSLLYDEMISDPCLYITRDGKLLLIGIYVDDTLLIERSEKRLKEVKSALMESIDMKDLGELNFLCVKVVQN